MDDEKGEGRRKDTSWWTWEKWGGGESRRSSPIRTESWRGKERDGEGKKGMERDDGEAKVRRPASAQRDRLERDGDVAGRRSE